MPGDRDPTASSETPRCPRALGFCLGTLGSWAVVVAGCYCGLGVESGAELEALFIQTPDLVWLGAFLNCMLVQIPAGPRPHSKLNRAKRWCVVIATSNFRSGWRPWVDGPIIPRTERGVVPLGVDGLMTNLRCLGVLVLQIKPQHRI